MTEVTSAPTWELSRWVLKSFQLMAVIAWIACVAITAICFVGMFEEWTPRYSLVGIILLPIASFAAALIHEFGHLKGAEWGQMIPVRMLVGNIDFKKVARGWKVRWHRSPLNLAGLVIAYATPDRSLRESSIKMTAGGPLANIAAAVFFFCIARYIEVGTLRLGFIGFAILNTAMGAINLLPTRKLFPSDGLQLLYWLRGFPEDDPSTTYTRLMGRSVCGTTAESLPDDEISALDSQPLPMPLVAIWLRLKASQNRGDWFQASGFENSLNQLLAQHEPAVVRQMDDNVVIMRAEIAFSKAMAAHEPSHVADIQLNSNARWFAPHLMPRLQAVAAKLAGDGDKAECYLRESEQQAEQSIDLALRASEALLRKSITRL